MSTIFLGQLALRAMLPTDPLTPRLILKGLFSDLGVDLPLATCHTRMNDSLAPGIIQPLSSPAGAGFFFVAKKGQDSPPLYRLSRTE